MKKDLDWTVRRPKVTRQGLKGDGESISRMRVKFFLFVRGVDKV